MQFCGTRQQEEIESLGTGKNLIIIMVFNKRNCCITGAVSLRKQEATWERKLPNNHHEQMKRYGTSPEEAEIIYIQGADTDCLLNYL